MHLSLSDSAFAGAQDHAACRDAIRHGSHTFFAASLLLPSKVRQPAYGLYAFCRLSDDAIDLEGGSLQALERLRDRLARAYDGRPLPIAADLAMADIVRHYAIPRELPEALLEGLGWDAEGRRFEHLDDLFDYAARVAGAVGAMMTLMMGVRSPDALARACDLGVAMQLTNIARDVGEDARAGRIYLPLQWLREAGIDPQDFLARPALTPALQGVVARLLDEADKLYARARGGIGWLPAACRPAILTASLLYAEIGRQLERMSLDSISSRARVSRARKLRLLGHALLATPLLRRGVEEPPLAAVDFLVAAAAQTPAAGARARPHRSKEMQLQRVLAMFERLERTEQLDSR